MPRIKILWSRSASPITVSKLIQSHLFLPLSLYILFYFQICIWNEENDLKIQFNFLKYGSEQIIVTKRCINLSTLKLLSTCIISRYTFLNICRKNVNIIKLRPLEKKECQG